MKKVILLLTLLTIQIQINGQSNASNNNPLETAIAIGTLSFDNFKTYDLQYDDVKGSPYLEKDILTGHVVLIDNKKTEELALQFDIHSNEFFYVNNKGEELVIDLKLIRRIVMKGKEEDYLFKRINPRRPHKFYEILYEGEGMDIYNEMEINFREGKDQGIAKIEPSFSRDDNYFIQKKGVEPKRVKLKKKDIYKLFSKEEQKLMDEIIKGQKIKLKKSKDFKKLFNSLKSNPK